MGIRLVRSFSATNGFGTPFAVQFAAAELPISQTKHYAMNDGIAKPLQAFNAVAVLGSSNRFKAHATYQSVALNWLESGDRRCDCHN